MSVATNVSSDLKHTIQFQQPVLQSRAVMGTLTHSSLLLGDIELGAGGKECTHHLDVHALRISMIFFQVSPFSHRQRPVRRLRHPWETFRFELGKNLLRV